MLLSLLLSTATSHAGEIRNYAAACDANPLYVTTPYASEAGYWAAGRVTPTRSAWISQVTYAMNLDYYNPPYQCRRITHHVRVWVDDGTTGAPDATPGKVVEYTVNANDVQDPDGDTDAYHTITLAAPVYVRAGQSLWVAVEQAYSLRGSLCTAVCGWAPTSPDQSYWSNGVSAPYAWSDFMSFGANFGDLMVKATSL